MPRPVVADAPPHREVLLFQVDILPGEGAYLPDAKPGVIGDLDGQQGRVVFPFQKALQCLELLMGEGGHSRGIPVLLGEQLVLLFLPPPDHILHGIEADKPLGEHRETERPLQDCRKLPQVSLAERLCRCAVRVCPAEAEKVDVGLQVIGGDTFQLAVADGVLLDAVHRPLVGHYGAVAEISGLQFLLHP